MNNRDTSAKPPPAQSLLGANELAERIADTITDFIFVFDVISGHILYTNRAVTVALGYPPEELMRLSYIELMNLIHPDEMTDDQTFVISGLHDLRDGDYLENEMRVRDHNGQWRTLHTRLSVFSRTPEGALEKIMGVMRDVTDLRRMQEALYERERIESALEKERELSGLKNRFMTTVSHEFRTPLSIIMSSAELLERYYERMTPERRAEAVNTINRQIRHLKKMLDDIWILLEHDQQSTEFSPRLDDLRAFCTRVVDDMFIEGGRAYPIQLYTEGSLSSVPFDANLLGPVLRNLLSNAMKYSTMGNVIRLEAIHNNDGIVLRVIDRGIGIRTEDRERIFDTFFRGSTVSHIPGVGLGLKIVRDNLRLHQGTIEVESDVGKGSVFTIRLPLEYTSTAV